MTSPRWTLRVAAAALALVLPPLTADVAAQGVTTGAVAGTITDRNSRPIEGAQVQVQNRTTGYSTGALTRANGYFLVPGLEVGGPYTLRVRRIGYEAAERNDIFVRLTQTTRVDVQLQQTAVQLAGVEVRATAEAADFSPSRQGVATTVVDTLIRRMPSLQRDFTDLVRLTPQVIPSSSTTGAGPSAAGGYNRLNNFTVDGANQNDRFSLGSTGGRPGGSTGGRIMSLEAVKEVQVALSPTDVRYGNFAGMIVNAVTRNGTNDWTGSAIYTFRTPQMAADVDQIRTSGFKVRNFGFSLGGPIIRDKLHFFIAPEWQERTDPTTGPALDPGASSLGTSNLRISADSVAEIINILGSRFDVGHAGPFSRGNPLKNLMGRIDWSINNANRLAFRVLDNTAEQDELVRNTNLIAANATQQSTGIRLTSNAFTRENRNRSFSTQLFTNLASGISNELLVGYNTVRDLRIVPVTAPEISVGVTPNGGTSPSIPVTAGTERFSPGNDLKQEILEVSNNVSIPFGAAHTFTVGARYEHTYIYNYFLSGAGYGAYRFPSIAALRAGTPDAYAFSYANGGPIEAEFNGQQISAFVQDLWNVRPNFAVTAGLRVDIPTFLDTPQQNPLITAAAPEIRTDWKPKTAALWSPRVGFNWDVTSTQSTQIRGNVGIYTGSVPYILVGNAYGNTGLGGVTVGCSGTAVPAFTTDVSQLPRSCAGQPAPVPGAAGTVGINVTDPDFKYPQNLTTSFGIDHRLPWNVVGTFEAIYRKEINGLYVRDLNLRGPRLVNDQIYRDPNGRVLYADTFNINATTGVPTTVNTGQRRIIAIGSPSVNFTEGAIMLTNSKAGHNYSLTGQLRKRFHRAFEATGAYTYMQSRDVQSLTSDRAISNWRFGRQYAGLENDPNDAQVSNFQRPHRIIAYGTWTAPWTRWQTDVTAYYELMSGHSITYVTNNDINGDNVGGNDPIYIPRDATDPTEIRIGTGAGTSFRLDQTTAEAFERFIELHPCLDKQRGQIMARNSCQAPFTRRMDVTVRQTLPEVQGQRVTLQLDVFNFANLLNRRWGQDKFPVGGTFNNLTALQTAGRETGPLSTAKWNYNMNTALFNNIRSFDSPWSLNPNSASNNYQLQLTARYSF
jgi:outer membrane receptor protein involved in Fe transport